MGGSCVVRVQETPGKWVNHPTFLLSEDAIHPQSHPVRGYEWSRRQPNQCAAAWAGRVGTSLRAGDEEASVSDRSLQGSTLSQW